MRRRVLITIAATTALLLVAAVSLAAWLSLKETQDSSFTAAAATVRVDLGNAETTPLFTVADMEPLDMVEACFRAEIDLSSTSPATVAKMYSGGVSGTGLADYLNIVITRDDPDPASVEHPGIFDCVDFTGTTVMASLETLTSYAASTASYTFGDSLGVLDDGRRNLVDIKVQMFLPGTAPIAASGLNATTSWIVEDQ